MRLIDADEVIGVIKEMQKAYPIEDQRPHARGVRVALFDCRNLIENQPTAYDVDKVVAKIRGNAEKVRDMGNAYLLDGLYEGLVRSIEIVKRGGVDAML